MVRASGMLTRARPFYPEPPFLPSLTYTSASCSRSGPPFPLFLIASRPILHSHHLSVACVERCDYMLGATHHLSMHEPPHVLSMIAMIGTEKVLSLAIPRHTLPGSTRRSPRALCAALCRDVEVWMPAYSSPCALSASRASPNFRAP